MRWQPLMWFLGIVAILFGLSAGPLAARQEEAASPDKPRLTVGDPAPNIDVEFWLSDDNGLFPHVTEFESGQVYVVDFWSPRWAPSIRQMPTLAKLQTTLGRDEVQIISIGDLPQAAAESFLSGQLPASLKKDQLETYADLTSVYCLTTDPDRSVFTDYFLASGRTQVPCCFVVGKQGKIEWIGHPMNLEEPLTEIIEDRFDREAFAKKYQAEMDKLAQSAEAERVLAKALQAFPAEDRGDREKVLQYLTESLDNPEYELARPQLQRLRLDLMVGMQHEEAPAALRGYADQFAADEEQAGELNDLAWAIYERHEALGDVKPEILKAALHMARVAVKLQPTSGAINDTVAHLVYVAEGNLDEAIEWQKKAVANAEGREADLQPFLDQLLQEKKTGKKKGSTKDDESDF